MVEPHHLPLLVEPEQLADRLGEPGEPGVLVVDLSPGETFREHHVPGSVHLPYGEIVASRPPVGGLLPDARTLERVLGAAGIGPGMHVVAVDAEGGGAAGRLLWTLEAQGHGAVSLLDGGLLAWVNEGFPVESGPGARPAPRRFHAGGPGDNVADAEYILGHLGRDDFIPLDARSDGEYSGATVRAARGGHIPGAAHYEWTRAMDRARNLRLRPADDLRAELHALGIRPEREIVTYCHSHHRSAFSYAMLRVLGFDRVRGYPGSWSDWGNRQDTPVA